MKHIPFNAIAAAAMCVAAAAPAHAATVINLTGNSSSSGTFGNERTFSGTSGGQTITVRATGWTIDGDTVTSAYLGAFGNGLGVTNRSEGNGSGSEHTIDNGGQNDFVVFQFDRAVSLLSAGLSTYGDTDVTFASLSARPVGPIMSLAAFAPTITASADSFGGNASRTAANPLTNFSSVWAVAALTPANGARDAFKLGSIRVLAAPVVPAVPEPSTWAMMLVGFGAIGGAMRRRRTGQVRFNFA